MKRIIPTTKVPAVKPGEATTGELRQVSVADITVLDNLNLRVVEGPPEDLIASIEANGFYADKPLSAYIDADGKTVLTDGHRRFAAVQSINEFRVDGEIETLPVIIRQGDAADVTVSIIQSSTGEPLTMYEKGIGVKRLLLTGMEKPEVARRLGVSEKTIDNWLIVASVPAKARDLLLDDKVTSTQVLRTKGDPDKLSAMVQKATAAGRTRARPSDAEKSIVINNTPGVQVAEGVDAAAAVDRAIEQFPHTMARLTDDDDTFSVQILKDADMSTVLRQLATEIRARVAHDTSDEGDAAHVNGTITVSLRLDPVKPAKKPRASKRPTEPDPLAHAVPADDVEL